ncbi:T9SS type A sorting domain-containing protein [Edaphocola aurantiacus]|uniref:T9SS type A sorting domain-containing protein n=1 Tax=Edaphocola aurantiacus TaxID=2601682 RepID=UPI001C96FA51|nr:T9SS type A sorting domain-containing protein [Edaphocola aurantiacus]
MKRDSTLRWVVALSALLSSHALTAQTPLTDVTTASTPVSLSSGSGASNILDNASDSYGSISASATFRVDLGTAKVITGYSLTNQDNNTNLPTNWRIEASNSATTGYVTLDTRAGNSWEKTEASRKFFAINNNTAYRYYRIVNLSIVSMRVTEMELFDNFYISGKVFKDYNLNNVKSGDEPAVPGVKVWIKKLSTAAPVAMTTSGEDGTYLFDASVLNGLEIFAVAAAPSGSLQPRTEPMPQSGLNFPSLTADGSFLFSNINANQYSQSGEINFGFLDPKVTTDGPVLENPNLVTNAFNGTFGSSDSTGNNFVLNHPNAKYFSLTASHPELYSNVTGYTTGSNYGYQGGSNYGTNGFLWDEGKYLVTDFLGTVFLESGSTDMELKGILNNASFGWRISTGATSGAWNDRFLAINGSSLQDSSLNARIFADTVTLDAGNTYSMGFYGKSANKWQQGAAVAKPTVVKYFVKRISTGDTAALGSISVVPTTSNATDSVNIGWNKAFTDFIANNSGSYGVYFIVTSSDVAGNDAYFDNFFLRKSSFKIAGRIYNDANGLENGLVDGSTISTFSGSAIYAYLIDPEDNHILGSTTVALDGSFSLFAPSYAEYKVAISSNSMINGSVYSAGSLPSNWAFTGSNSGTNNLSGSNIIAVNPMITVSPVNTTTDVTQITFGYDRLPESYNRNKNVSGAPVYNSFVSLSDVPLQGSDMEDNAGVQVNWNTKKLKIVTLPTAAFILKYNGSALVAGSIITSYDPSLLSIAPSLSTPGGTLNTSFTYVTYDAANLPDATAATYTVTYTQPLPIELAYFRATVEDCNAILSWASNTEIQFREFGVERSNDGKTFTEIGTVSPTGSNSKYMFKDVSAEGKLYYRLKLVDNDRSFTYSTIANAFVNCMKETLIFPTVAKNVIYIQNATINSKVSIYNINGSMVKELTINSNMEQVDLTGLAAANYLVTVNDNGKITSAKIVKE